MSERHLIVLFDKRAVIVSKEQAVIIKQALKEGAQFVEVKGNLYRASAIAGIEKQKSSTQNAEQQKAEQLFLPASTNKPVKKETLEKINALHKRLHFSIKSFPQLTSFEKGQVRAEEDKINNQVVCSEEGWYIDPETGDKIYS